MAPTSQPRSQHSKSSFPKTNVIKLETSIGTTSKRLDPLTAFKTSDWKLDSDTHSTQTNNKGKGKEKAEVKHCENKNENRYDRLWVDVYEPSSEAELAVHCRKVQDVRGWLNEAFEGGPSGKLTKYRRILALTGPAGTAKTTTVRVLAREMGFEILEWRNVAAESRANWLNTSSHASSTSYDTFATKDYDPDREPLFSKFEIFLTRAFSCRTVFPVNSDPNFWGKETSSQSSRTQNPSKSFSQKYARQVKHRIILLEDLPNILHSKTQLMFHEALQSLVASPPSFPPVPVVIIVSDAGTRGEAIDERMANGGGWGKDKDAVVDIRTVLPRDLLGGPYVAQIGFNPIAPTLLRKALQALLNKHSACSTKPSPFPKGVLDMIVESANGDIRSATMALQFACVVELGGGVGRRQERDSVAVLGAVTRREQSLALFHLLGKVLYNKRKGDTPSASASAQDIQREKLVDAQLKDPPKLAPFLQDHERRTSRVDVNILHADSPIDSSLFSLYIHQNYTQYCDDINNCDGIADWLSCVDSSGGEAWYQKNPYYFHLLALGTLHSLPSPVSRRSQKCFKPEFFNFMDKEKKAYEGVRDVGRWLHEAGTSRNPIVCRTSWRLADISTELGGILRARDAAGGPEPPPASHRLFSKFVVTFGKVSALQTLDEGDLVDMAPQEEDGGQGGWLLRENEDGGGGWLDGDDIEDF